MSELTFPLAISWKEAFGQPSRLARGLPPALFLSLRVLLAAFWTGVLAWSLVDHFDKPAEPDAEWWIYLTNWSLLFEWVYLLLAALLALLSRGSLLRDGHGAHTPALARVAYGMQAATYTISFIVFALYWTLDHDYDKGSVDGITFVTHGVNFLVALVDLLIAGLPVHKAHIWVPCVFAVTYVLFTIIYDMSGGKAGADPYIYEVIDWSAEPGKAIGIACAVVLIAFPAVFCVCLCISSKRDGPAPPPRQELHPADKIDVQA
ncbi:hypothetical protein AB1Y20_010312 [Prymnesium parvum]|uniref:Protein rolling stone-like n=1 Tax=Prymnesium parvum TaxID=97485 RepID=A0AB34K801_PRYPA